MVDYHWFRDRSSYPEVSTVKYNIVISEGCTANGVSVNGKEWYGEYQPTRMTEDEREEFVSYLLDKIKEGYETGEIGITELIRLFSYDNYEVSPTCETCGDSVEIEYRKL